METGRRLQPDLFLRSCSSTVNHLFFVCVFLLFCETCVVSHFGIWRLRLKISKRWLCQANEPGLVRGNLQEEQEKQGSAADMVCTCSRPSATLLSASRQTCAHMCATNVQALLIQAGR